MENRDTTCQVCGRQVKSKSGLIAHHGYKRPYEGWQTASCEGARYLPYEVSCERLREVAVWVEQFIAKQEVELEAFLATPPQTLKIMERRSSWDRNSQEVSYEKPEDFGTRGSNYRSYMPNTYEHAYSNRKYAYEQTIKLAKMDLVSMQRRLNEWKATAA